MRLLLAEDEKELSKALTAILKHNGYSVDAVYNGKDALDYLLGGDYDCAILDIMMPLLDGISVLKEIRHDGLELPVVMLTAKSEIDDKVLGLDSGADDYVTKPFVAKELIARIKAVTRRKSETESPNLTFENITLNRSTCELSSDKARIRLANKEYQMLEMFMSNPKQIISPDRFMEKIWGFDSDTEQNVVWVYISYLRKKLTTVGANVKIKAARNMGYSLEAEND